ncbi:MAG: TRAP transporter large permease [Candidatus Marinimicrobia bacterium]|nr:TRAP transporter large permease [Candidatus Neomarinimicrobiota bacterium]MCF7827391.1 TRAP transporter large permease [Candidatus Neomarinimicrobiota bacterium]MCF7881376.1 TRAP transporter large permease [Candidatus Neomarinimicrobiota bacterium]
MVLTGVIVLVVSFVVLLILGVPISFTIGLSTLFTMLVSVDPIPAFTTIAQRMATGLDSFALLAIPFFILAGQIMNHGGIARRLIRFAEVMVGGLRGGLSYVIVVACMLFGAISGSAVAATAAIGGFLIPLMVKKGYELNFSTALNITASTTGLLIPPSNILIVYAFASGGTSVAALFLAGYMPGILVGVGLMAVAAIYSMRMGFPKGDTVGLKEGVIAFFDALPSIFMIVVVIGGIVAGYFTATEASAIAVAYAFVLAVLIYREVKWKEIPKILLDTSSTTAMVMMLIATSIAMSWIMSYVNIPQAVSSTLIGLTDSKIVIFIIINIILLLVGTFMDMTPAVLIFTPIFLPVVQQLGMDPVHFGIMMVLNLCVGLCTPPVGTVLFVGTGISNTSIEKVVKPLLPLYAVMVIGLMIVTFIPWISMWLPTLFGF